MNKRFTKRKHPAHYPPQNRGNNPIILLVTVCVWKRLPLLDNEFAHRTLVAAWLKYRDWEVGRYVIMPDHVHLFCRPMGHDRHSIRSWAEIWKRECGIQNPNMMGIFEWDCLDTQMRTVGHYCRKLEYVRLNPVRKDLVANSDEWPFQGRINPLSW